MSTGALTQESEAQLRAFRRVARQVRDRSAIDRDVLLQFRSRPGPDGRPAITGFGDSDLVPEEPFRALLTSVRLAYMDREPAYFWRICNILHQGGDVSVQEAVAEVRAGWSQALAVGMTIKTKFRDGSVVDLRPKDMLETWMNAEVFHLDQDREREREILEMLGELALFNVQGVVLQLAGRILDLDDIVADFLGEERLPRINPESAAAPGAGWRVEVTRYPPADGPDVDASPSSATDTP